MFDDGIVNMLADAEFDCVPMMMDPAEYLYDHYGVVGTNLPAVVRCLRAGEHHRELDNTSQGGPLTGDNELEARALAQTIADRLCSLTFYMERTQFFGRQMSFIGKLIECGGSAALPLAEKLLCLGFKLQPDALNGRPLLAPIVDHFLRRFWVEKNVQLPNAKGLDALRCVLLWLTEKTGDNLQINWKPPAG
jgi:hypothetical protein